MSWGLLKLQCMVNTRWLDHWWARGWGKFLNSCNQFCTVACDFRKRYYWSCYDWIPSPKVSWGATLTRIRSSTVPPGAQTSTELSLEAEKRSRACIQERKWVTQPACSLVHKVMCPLSMSHHLITPSIRVIKVTCYLCEQGFTSGRTWNFYLYMHINIDSIHLYA